MKYIITTGLEIEEGFYCESSLPLFKIESDNEQEILNGYRDFIIENNIEIVDDSFLDMALDDLNDWAIWGSVFIADRSSDYCGNVAMNLYPTVYTLWEYAEKVLWEA